MREPQTLLMVVISVVFVLFFVSNIVFFFLVIRPWMRAFMHGTPVSLMQIVAMRLRGNSPVLLIDAYITLRRTNADVSIGQVENVYVDSRSRIMTSDDLVNIVRSAAATQASLSND